MLTLSEIRKALRDRRVKLVAEATGLHYNTIREIRDNPDSDPKLSTIKALSAYLSENK